MCFLIQLLVSLGTVFKTVLWSLMVFMVCLCFEVTLIKKIKEKTFVYFEPHLQYCIFTYMYFFPTSLIALLRNISNCNSVS